MQVIGNTGPPDSRKSPAPGPPAASRPGRGTLSGSRDRRTRNGKRRPPPAADGGFTLLELLISLTLLVVILVITMGAMRIGSRSVEAAGKKMEDLERFRTVLSLLDAQVQSQVPLTYEEEGNRRYYFWGDGKTLRLATNHSLWGGERGYVVVEYRIAAGASGNDILSASEQVPGIEGLREIRLMEADAMSFDYFYREPSEEQGRWMENLSGTLIPERVRLHLTRRSGQLALTFPVRVRREMMLVQGGTGP